MPQSSLTDWLQTLIQLATLVGVAAYTWITYRMFRASQVQNKAISDQLELQRLAHETEREERHSASLPTLEWLNNFVYSGPISDRIYQNTIINRGRPVKDLKIEASGATSTFKISPSDYLDTEGMTQVELLLPDPEARGEQPFKFTVYFTTMTGLKAGHTFEVLIPNKPRSIGICRHSISL